jgi:hypothetical protein
MSDITFGDTGHPSRIRLSDWFSYHNSNILVQSRLSLQAVTMADQPPLIVSNPRLEQWKAAKERAAQKKRAARLDQGASESPKATTGSTRQPAKAVNKADLAQAKYGKNVSQTQAPTRQSAPADRAPAPKPINRPTQSLEPQQVEPEQLPQLDLRPPPQFERRLQEQQPGLRKEQDRQQEEKQELDAETRERMRLADYFGNQVTTQTLAADRTDVGGARRLSLQAENAQQKLMGTEQTLRESRSAQQPELRTVISQKVAKTGDVQQRMDPKLQKTEQILARYDELKNGPLNAAARHQFDKADEAAHRVKTKLGPAAYAALERGDASYSTNKVYQAAVNERVYAVEPELRPQTLDQTQNIGADIGLELRPSS